MLNPSDSVVDWVLKTVPTMGAGWCPPGMLGIGIGGTAEKAMYLAKLSLMDPIDIQDLIARGATTTAEKLRIELYDKVNRLGIGAQGLGGLTTVLDVKVLDTPAHAANLPVAMIPNCAATRHAHIVLDGSGPVYLDPPNLDDWPKLTYDVSGARRVNLDTVTRAEAATWKPGEVLLLTGKLLTGRDRAHKRMTDMLNRGEKLPVDFRNRFIYYVGPVDPVREEVVGPAGPTTATRMDKFTRQMLAETGLLGMVGKAERGPAAIEAIREFGAVYLMAVGGAAYLVSKAIHGSRLLAFEDLGMEAIYEFDVRDMPVTVAVDSKGTSVHQTGPAEWQQRIARHPHPAITGIRCQVSAIRLSDQRTESGEQVSESRKILRAPSLRFLLVARVGNHRTPTSHSQLTKSANEKPRTSIRQSPPTANWGAPRACPERSRRISILRPGNAITPTQMFCVRARLQSCRKPHNKFSGLQPPRPFLISVSALKYHPNPRAKQTPRCVFYLSNEGA